MGKSGIHRGEMQHSSLDARLLCSPEHLSLCGDGQRGKLQLEGASARQVYGDGLAGAVQHTEPGGHSRRNWSRECEFRLQSYALSLLVIRSRGAKSMWVVERSTEFAASNGNIR